MRSTVRAQKRWRGSSVARLSLLSVSAFSEPRWWHSHFCGRTWDGCRGDPAIRRRRARGRSVLGALAVYVALRWYRERTGFATGGTGRVIASDTGVEASILLRDPSWAC